MSANPNLRGVILGLLSGCALVGVARAGQETQTAYANFPEVPPGWYATGCCTGAVIAEDIQVAPGTEGLRLAQIVARLFVDQAPADLPLYVYRHDEQTGLPGELLGSKLLEAVPAEGFQVLSIDVWSLDIRIPASGRLWIAVYAPNINAGWNIADAEPSTGSSGNFYARDSGDGFTFHYPFDPLEFIDLMLRVEAAPEPCPADINGDNFVDVDDLVALILDWGCTDPPTPCPGDVNFDGIVDVDDLVAVILAWGNCFPV